MFDSKQGNVKAPVAQQRELQLLMSSQCQTQIHVRPLQSSASPEQANLTAVAAPRNLTVTLACHRTAPAPLLLHAAAAAISCPNHPPRSCHCC